MAALHLVTCQVQSQLAGAGFAVPLGFYSDEDAAKRAAKEAQAVYNVLVNCKLVGQPPGEPAPKMIGNGHDLLAHLGVARVGFAIFSGEMHGAIAVPPDGPRIIMP